MIQDKEGNFLLNVGNKYFSYQFKYIPNKNLNADKSVSTESGTLRMKAIMNKLSEGDSETITRQDNVKIMLSGLEGISVLTRTHILHAHLLYQLTRTICANILEGMDVIDSAVEESINTLIDVAGDCNSHLLSSHSIISK